MFCLLPQRKVFRDVEELLDHKGKPLLSGDGTKICSVLEYSYMCFLWFKFNKKII